MNAAPLPPTEQPWSPGIPVPVNSRCLATVTYFDDHRVLEVQLRSGAVYQYLWVPPEAFQALLNAQSKGRYFNQYIRRSFEYFWLRSS